MGRVTVVTAKKPGGTATPVVSNVTYEPFGPVTGMKFGNGMTEARTFDLDYRLGTLTDTATSALQHLTYGYDADSNVKTIANAVTPANSQTLGYDTLNRLNSAVGGYGSLVYTYDQVGNRLTEKRGTVTTNYGYTANTDLLRTLTIGTTTTETFGYTAAGNINNFNPGIMGAGSSPITSLTYNQANRLATVLAGTSNAAAYTYDASGNRIVKATGATTLYQYDRNGHLLEEASGTGVAQVDYLYLDGMPVATIAPATGKLYFIHSDRLGTPQLATDGSQAIAWQTTYQPFGATGTVSGLITQNLRLPGQQFDAETGFNHNGFREYLPNLGRYLESDPIGISGGLNLYSYVEGSPLSYVDPAGLAACTVLFPDYPIDTGFGFTSTSIGGHGGVLSYDDQGSTRYYEFGRYSPSNQYVTGDKRPDSEGNVRRVPIPDLVIDPKTGQPTPASLEALRKALSERAGHKTKANLTCDKDTDEKKVNKYAEDFANNKDRPPYSWKPWSSNQCRDFANRAFGAGK